MHFKLEKNYHELRQGVNHTTRTGLQNPLHQIKNLLPYGLPIVMFTKRGETAN